MNQSNTPRTDKNQIDGMRYNSMHLVTADFARQLETELADANKRADELTELIQSIKSHAIDVNDEFLQKLLEKI